MSLELDPVAVAFNISAFVAGVSLLQQGADKFTRSTIEIAKYLHVSDILVALLTAGAEWEELTIVILCLVQDRHELAVGLLLGSCIANVLGAFPLALVVHPPNHRYARSSGIYSAILLFVSAIVAVLSLTNALNQTGGIALLVLFLIYVVFVSWSISRGIVAAPHDVEVPKPPSLAGAEEGQGLSEREGESPVASTTTTPTTVPESSDESTPLLSQVQRQVQQQVSQVRNKITEARARIKRVIAPISRLVAGLTALPVSAFLLSRSSTNLADSLGIPDVVFGITVLAFATNLPEKLANIMDDQPDSIDLLIADIVGGNTFLLTLCLGIIVLSDTSGENAIERVVIPGVDVIWMFATATLMMLVILVGRPYKVAGFLIIAGYIAFFFLRLAPFIDLSKIHFPDPPDIPGIPHSSVALSSIPVATMSMSAF